MNNNRHMENNDSDVYVWLFLLGTLSIAIFIVYKAFYVQINTALMWVNLNFLKVISCYSDEAAYVHRRLCNVSPARMSFNYVQNVMIYVGQFLRWPVALILIGLSVAIALKKRVSDMKQVLNLNDLLKNNVEHFPCIAPAVNRKKNILDEPMDSGPWALAQTPLRWAFVHDVLRDREGNPLEEGSLFLPSGLVNEKSKYWGKLSIDKEVAEKAFAAQLGDRLGDPMDLPEYIIALAAVFLAYGHGDKDEAHELLDQMSLSFIEEDDEYEAYLDTTEAFPLFESYWEKRQEWAPELNELMDIHSQYVHTWLHALLVFARRKGVLAPQEFLWLRPLDRTLWYCLNQVGGRTAWPEASGEWAHYRAEEVLSNLKCSIVGKQQALPPQVEEAVKGLEFALDQEGWLEGDT